MSGALAGVRVIDLTNRGPGARCAKILADLGADVIRVVGGRSIPTRWWLYGARRNTRVIGIDLKSRQGTEVFFRLLASADVLMVGLRPKAVAGLGLDYTRVHEACPRIIYCSCTAFGVDGPYSDYAGHDVNYQAIGGSLGMTGRPGEAPVIPGATMADSAGGGMQAAIGILAALLARQRTGRGQLVDIAATDGVVELMSVVIDEYLATGVESRRGETMLTGLYAWHNVYETKDGKYISLGAVEPWFFENLCRVLGCSHFLPHQFSKGEQREEMFRVFRETFLTKTRDEWTSLLMSADTCTAPVYSVSEVTKDPQILHRKMVIEVDHPVRGKFKQVGPMFKFSDTPCVVGSLDPQLGVFTDQLMGELGYSTSEIETLKDAGTVN